MDGVANTGEDKSRGTVLATEFNGRQFVCRNCKDVPRMHLSTDECSQDCAILRSMLTDGHYEITDEDRAALQTVINILSTGSGSCDITNEPTVNEMTYDYGTSI